jgi:hypothetical protein
MLRVKGRLEQKFGPGIPFDSFNAWIRRVTLAHGLPRNRDVARNKSTAIRRVCEHMDVVGPYLDSSEDLPPSDPLVVSQWDKIPVVQKLMASEIHTTITNAALIQWAAGRGLQLDRAAKRNRTVLWCQLAQNSHRLWPTPPSAPNPEAEPEPLPEIDLPWGEPIGHSLDGAQW